MLNAQNYTFNENYKNHFQLMLTYKYNCVNFKKITNLIENIIEDLIKQQSDVENNSLELKILYNLKDQTINTI